MGASRSCSGDERQKGQERQGQHGQMIGHPEGASTLPSQPAAGCTKRRRRMCRKAKATQQRKTKRTEQS